ncbi:unnamed protein product [Effrenium voratum]|uniref:Ubiquitin thioesterase OTU n=2 Tax=Effrenium voratum TaxID=2562239 RepID=A0AA36I6B4_9DINO|nr:unnamed protein product [Effrenium voratum]CAJ1380479.1 unnamed protein product [Effrenium voratum]CAJ1439851.1 unnamed protein product [Effrenium voratum]
MAVAVRRRVPNDHSCLFWAIAYLTEGEVGRAKAKELREVCAQDALRDSDPSRALLLGFNSVEEYANWIRNEFHWGGENEILCLARHYGVEAAVVCCESMQVLCYGSDLPTCSARIYLLYTGQHYDPIVAAANAETPVEHEQKRQKKGDSSLESGALLLAKQHVEEAAKKAKQRRAKKIKCGGCGALLSDAEAFASHCGEVEHGDDFAYDCEEVEVVIEEGDDLPDGTVDLNADHIYSFTNTGKDPLCHAFPASFTVAGISFPSMEHYWQAAPFMGQDDTLAQRIAAAPSVDEAMIVAGGAGPHAQRGDWREKRGELLWQGLQAKAAASSTFVQALRATGSKTLVYLDPDPWAGMTAPGGLATGQNSVGKALMEIRAQLP